LVHEKSESPEGTLLWEFGKTLAESIGHPKDITFILMCEILVIEAL